MLPDFLNGLMCIFQVLGNGEIRLKYEKKMKDRPARGNRTLIISHP